MQRHSSMDSDEHPSILMLNDDCLAHCFKKLELKDQIRFSCTCKRLREVFKMVCKIEHKRHNLFTTLNLWETQKFLEMAGPFIEILTGTGPYKYEKHQEFFEFISYFCPNIQQLQFVAFCFKSDVLEKLLNKLTNVTRLMLENCSLNNEAMLTIAKLPKLKMLSVADNYKLTGKYMDRLKSLDQLILHRCKNIKPTHFINACKSFKDLRSLNILLCKLLSANAFREMATNCINLETLKMSPWNPDVQYEYVARLPRLKTLTIFSSSAVRLELFNELVEHKANQLEYLNIIGKNCVGFEQAQRIACLINLKKFVTSYNESLTDDVLRMFGDLQNLEEINLSYCPSITNDGLLGLLCRCSKLKRVMVEGCPFITNQFALSHEIIEIKESCAS